MNLRVNDFRRSAAVLVVLLPLALSACNGTAVVTLTATRSSDNFLAYRVGLAAVDLETSDGASVSKALPSSTTVDLARLSDFSEVLGAATSAKASYKSVVVTLDYSSSVIVYDDGSVDGLALTPVDAAGQPVGRVKVGITLDPSDSIDVAIGKTTRLALDFKLGATNLVNAAAKTVTVTPLIVGSATPFDSKLVRVRGPLSLVDTTDTRYTLGIAPFDFPTLASGQVIVTATDSTTYQVDGTASTGAAGLAQLAALSGGAMTVALGTLTPTTTTTTTTTDGTTTTSTSSNLTFSATQVSAGTSVQSAGFDRISGVVSGRSGNTLTLDAVTLVAADGVNTFLPGTAVVALGTGTLVNVTGQGVAELNTIQQISVGSSIHAFGTVTTQSAGNLTLDASVGMIELGLTPAWGLVTVQGSGSLNLNLMSLGGRSMAVFDFVGTGASGSAVPASYVVGTGALDLTNATVGVPVEVSGLTASFGAGPPDFTASTLLDPTTIPAVLVLDWSGGTAAPFTTLDSSALDLDARNASIGGRHLINVGSQSVNIVGLASDPLITPAAGTTVVFAIGHASSGVIENFITYAAFVTTLQSELNGTVLATGITATGVYTASNSSFSATSITLALND